MSDVLLVQGNAMTLHIGVTGMRHGGTTVQLKQAEAYLHQHPGSEVHTGGCIGFDEDMHVLARTLGLTIHMHPPTDTRLMTRLLGDVLYQPLPYLQRNHAIVDACDVLLAAPRTRQEEQRSGTWATVRYARKVGKEVVMLWPTREEEMYG